MIDGLHPTHHIEIWLREALEVQKRITFVNGEIEQFKIEKDDLWDDIGEEYVVEMRYSSQIY